ncbi:uncharacterized protein LOC134473783 [Cavia porcellus]|uniref:uncharacterized protein LOC134473783 n=1 Tax=Cavia porcellus TaxID=10141 RepID=UPI002FE198D4
MNCHQPGSEEVPQKGFGDLNSPPSPMQGAHRPSSQKQHLTIHGFQNFHGLCSLSPLRSDQREGHNSSETLCIFVYKDLPDTQVHTARKHYVSELFYFGLYSLTKDPDDVEPTEDNIWKMAVMGITLAVILTLLGLAIIAILLTRWTRRKQNEIDASRYSSEQSARLLDYEDGADSSYKRSKRTRGLRHSYSTESAPSVSSIGPSHSSLVMSRSSVDDVPYLKAAQPLSSTPGSISGAIGPIMQFSAPIPGATGPIKLSQKTIVQTPGPIVQYTGHKAQASEMTTTGASMGPPPGTFTQATPLTIAGSTSTPSSDLSTVPKTKPEKPTNTSAWLPRGKSLDLGQKVPRAHTRRPSPRFTLSLLSSKPGLWDCGAEPRVAGRHQSAVIVMQAVHASVRTNHMGLILSAAELKKKKISRTDLSS